MFLQEVAGQATKVKLSCSRPAGGTMYMTRGTILSQTNESQKYFEVERLHGAALTFKILTIFCSHKKIVIHINLNIYTCCVIMHLCFAPFNFLFNFL